MQKKQPTDAQILSALNEIIQESKTELKSKKDIENKESNSISPLSYFEDQHFDLIFNCSQDENRMYPYTEIIDKLKENGDYVTLNSTLFDHLGRQVNITNILLRTT